MNRKEPTPVKALSPRDGNPEKIRVLFYHRIGIETHERPSDGLTVSPRTFRAQLRLLEKWGYSPITFHDYRLYLRGELSLPKNPVILTFDDGYADLYTHALPVMKEFGMRGVIFVVGDRQMRTNEWDADTASLHPLLDEEQILEFHEAGFEIGTHSMHHLRLTEMAPAEAWEELHQARIQMEILLNAPVHTFSYPYGLMNDGIKDMVKAAGYTAACAAFTGPPIFGSDPFEVRRIKMVDTANPLNVWFRLQLVYLHYRWIWLQCKKAALAVNRRIAALFHYHPHGARMTGTQQPITQQSITPVAEPETHA